jgi:hypothetical protein
MTHTNTNPPAFPHIDSGCGRFEEGMTMRDYFAAKAMQGEIGHQNNIDELAALSYRVADAMLQARNSCNKL